MAASQATVHDYEGYVQASSLIVLPGLAEAVREQYSFIATNWEQGDEIFLFGFSRGAYTARATAGLISEIGLLTRDGLPYLAEIFRDVQHRHDADYHPKHPDIPFRNKPSELDPSYRKELQRVSNSPALAHSRARTN